MLELRVYCYGVLRYTIIGDWDMLQELQNRGYFVQAKPALQSNIGLGVGNRNEQFMSIEDSHVFVHHDGGIHKLAEERPDGEHYTLDFS
jgi:hypothetical protein